MLKNVSIIGSGTLLTKSIDETDDTVIISTSVVNPSDEVSQIDIQLKEGAEVKGVIFSLSLPPKDNHYIDSKIPINAGQSIVVSSTNPTCSVILGLGIGK